MAELFKFIIAINMNQLKNIFIIVFINHFILLKTKII